MADISRQLRTTRRLKIVTVTIGAIGVGVLAYLNLGRFVEKQVTTTAAPSTTTSSTTTIAPLVLTTDTNSRLAAMVGDGKLVDDQVLEAREFELGDAQQMLCTIDGTAGPCQVEAFAFGESTGDRTKYTCAKLDRATYRGSCVEGKLEGVSVLIADGTAKLSREAFLSYFSRGRLVYPALTTHLDSDTLNFGVRERSHSYGCVYYGLWDESTTRQNCARMRKVYGDDIFSEANARALNDRSFHLEKYAENFRQYLLNPQ